MNTMNDFNSNSVLTDDGTGPELLPSGDYKGRIAWLDEEDYPGGAKIGPCPKKILTIDVKTESGVRQLKAVLFVWPTMSWKLSEFFRSVGRKKHGQPYKMDWTGLVGQRLKVHVGVRSYIGSDGQRHTVNQIDRFYDYDPADFPEEDDWADEAENPFDDVF